MAVSAEVVSKNGVERKGPTVHVAGRQASGHTPDVDPDNAVCFVRPRLSTSTRRHLPLAVDRVGRTVLLGSDVSMIVPGAVMTSG